MRRKCSRFAEVLLRRRDYGSAASAGHGAAEISRNRHEIRPGRRKVPAGASRVARAAELESSSGWELLRAKFCTATQRVAASCSIFPSPVQFSHPCGSSQRWHSHRAPSRRCSSSFPRRCASPRPTRDPAAGVSITVAGIARRRRRADGGQREPVQL